MIYMPMICLYMYKSRFCVCKEYEIQLGQGKANECNDGMLVMICSADMLTMFDYVDYVMVCSADMLTMFICICLCHHMLDRHE
jgi:hypothetical protein